MIFWSYTTLIYFFLIAPGGSVGRATIKSMLFLFFLDDCKNTFKRFLISFLLQDIKPFVNFQNTTIYQLEEFILFIDKVLNVLSGWDLTARNCKYSHKNLGIFRILVGFLLSYGTVSYLFFEIDYF